MSEPGATEGDQVSEETHERLDSSQAVMMTVVARHNELQTTLGNSWKIHVDDKTKFDLEVPDAGVNNLVTVDAINEQSISHVNLGHYDPGMQQFLFDPRLLHPDEAAIIGQLARQRRAEAVLDHPEFDFDADVIRDIHKRHREVLLEDGLIYKIAERFQDLPPQERGGRNEVLIDDATSFYACLTPRLGGMDKSDIHATKAGDLFITDEAVVTVNLEGSLARKGGELSRGHFNLHVGMRDLDDPVGKYVPNRRLVTDAEFRKILSLTQELQHLKSTALPSLDTEHVALKVATPPTTR